jgi:hypothetical protein
MPDFSDLIMVVSGETGIAPQLVEKDYWIMHCLYGLAELDLSFELKGGTSLSKAYQIIHRFSEDIDIRIEPPQEMNVKCGKNQNKAIHVQSRDRFYDWLVNDKIKIHGITEQMRDHNFDNAKLTSSGISLKYPATHATLDGLKPGILLEIGFDTTTPNNEITISSWAYDKAEQVGISMIDNRAKDVKCYDPAYTFVEKLQTISTKFRRQQADNSFPKNFLRHYYDIYCLLGCENVLQFIGSDNYIDWKKKRFPKADNLCIAQNEAFILSNENVLLLYKTEYEATRDLYYDGMIPFKAILSRIQEHIHKL